MKELPMSFSTDSIGKSLLRTSVLTVALAVCSSAAQAAPNQQDQSGEPTADAFGTISKKIVHPLADWVLTMNPFGNPNAVPAGIQPPAGSTAPATSPISYHTGPVMTSLSKVVVIWYGNWNQSNSSDTPVGQQIIRDALYGLSQVISGSSTYTNYAGITTTATSSQLSNYYQTDKSSVTQVSAETIEEHPQPTSSTYGGKTLTDAYVLKLVKTYASANGASPDPNAIYLVLSSSDIAESSGFLSRYCGWHTYATVGTTPVKYAFIGNPKKRLSSCSYQTTASPNNNPGVDAMTSVIAHELMEAVTDPQLNAWYNANGQENGDMCAWTFGSNQTLLANGSYYNVTLPTSSTSSGNYLLQRALASTNSACYINADGPQQ